MKRSQENPIRQAFQPAVQRRRSRGRQKLRRKDVVMEDIKQRGVDREEYKQRGRQRSLLSSRPVLAIKQDRKKKKKVSFHPNLYFV